VEFQNHSFRNESSFFKENFVLPPDLSLPLTNLESELTSNLGDYGNKASMKRAFNKKAALKSPCP
jgi:hypothetical protein